MQYKYCFEIIHRILKDIRRSDVLFRGILIIFGGDFAQILPVIHKVNYVRTVDLQQSFL